jgi:outer membrane protein assembly factor BamB
MMRLQTAGNRRAGRGVYERNHLTRHMLKKLLKAFALVVIVAVVAGAGAYAAGLRLVLDGGGMPRLQFQRSSDEQAEAIARHREAQRAQTAPPAPDRLAASAPVDAPAPAPGTASVEAAVPPAVDPKRSPDWTDFRGPRRDGHYQQPAFTAWPAGGLTPLWKQPVGGGYASFVSANGRAFTIEQRGGEEVVTAYDVRTGRELWAHEWSGVFREMMGGDGPRATPTWHEGVVYALGGSGELRALDDRTGEQRWRTNILQDAGASNLQWGMAAAPLIVDDTVVVLPGGSGGNSVVAYDRRTGRKAWSALDDRQAYSSPMLVTIAGIRQILVFSASRLMGITPDRGDVLWEFPWTTQYDVNASQPLVIGDRVFISTGYGAGAAMVEISRDGERLTARELWRTNRMKNQFTSSVYHDGLILGLDEAILACLDARSGEILWKGGRYGYGQVMLAGGHLIVLTEGGDLVLVRPDRKAHIELAKFSAIEGKSWNHPAMSGGILLVRNIAEMAAFDLRPR